MPPHVPVVSATDDRVKEFFTAGPAELLVTDVDGTLLTPDHQLTSRTLAALWGLRDNGVPVVLATGKMRPSIKGILEAIGAEDSSHSININGLRIYNGRGEVISETVLDISTVLGVARACWARGYACALYCGEMVVAREENAITAILEDFHEPAATIEADVERQLIAGQWKVHKMIVMAALEDIPRVRADLETVFDPAMATFTVAIPYMLELMPAGVSKATALRKVCDIMGVNIGRTVAFGDGENDVDLIAACGLGVAMANGCEAAMRCADVVTGPNTADGLAAFVEAHML